MATPYIRSQLHSGLVRLRVTPDEPAEGPPAITERPRGSRLPHTDLTVAKVRHLVETTVLNYREIAAETGTTNCAVSRWTRDGGWQRPLNAPRASDMMPNWRAGPPAETAQACRPAAGDCRTLCPRAGTDPGRRSRQADRGAPSAADGAAGGDGQQGPPPPLARPGGQRRMEGRARQSHLYRAEGNAPRRRRPRPRAERGAGSGDRG